MKQDTASQNGRSVKELLRQLIIDLHELGAVEADAEFRITNSEGVRRYKVFVESEMIDLDVADEQTRRN